MAELKITTLEGSSQFQAEGDTAVVRELLTEWRARNDRLHTEALADYDRMVAQTGGIGPQLPTGPGGGAGVTSPFKRRG